MNNILKAIIKSLIVEIQSESKVFNKNKFNKLKSIFSRFYLYYDNDKGIHQVYNIENIDDKYLKINTDFETVKIPFDEVNNKFILYRNKNKTGDTHFFE